MLCRGELGMAFVCLTVFSWKRFDMLVFNHHTTICSKGCDFESLELCCVTVTFVDDAGRSRPKKN